jgi:predicted type IV restriction endonuclease
MKYLISFCIILLCNFPLLAQRNFDSELSADVLKLRELLENDKSIIELNCRRSEKIKTIKESSKVKLKQFKVFKSAKNTLKTKYTCSTIEGDPITNYLIIENGKATRYYDSTRDAFGLRQIYKTECSELNIGTYILDSEKKKTIFQKLELKQTKKKELYLQCVSTDANWVF